MVEQVKKAMWISGNGYDEEIARLTEAAKRDLGFADVTEFSSPEVIQAIITYCRLNFGSPADYDRLKRSYDEQKAQLQSCHED